MLKLFLSSHGHMASGMKSSIEIFCGQNNNLTVFDAYVDEKNVSEQLDAFYENGILKSYRKRSAFMDFLNNL